MVHLVGNGIKTAAPLRGEVTRTTKKYCEQRNRRSAMRRGRRPSVKEPAAREVQHALLFFPLNKIVEHSRQPSVFRCFSTE